LSHLPAPIDLAPATLSHTEARPSRRTWLLAAAAGLGVGLGAGLSGCGFALRQPTALPYTRIALQGFAVRSPMLDEIRHALPPSCVVVDSPAAAQAVIVALEDKVYRTVAASTSAGEVREFRLRVTLKFRLAGPGGEEWLPATELEQSRDMSYTESAALAKGSEEAGLLRAMRADLARQLLAMLAATGRQAR